MTQAEQMVKLTEHVVTIKAGIESLKDGQARQELLFTNHLTHHREDRIKTEDRFRKWLWISIPTIATLFIALVGAILLYR